MAVTMREKTVAEQIAELQACEHECRVLAEMLVERADEYDAKLEELYKD